MDNRKSTPNSSSQAPAAHNLLPQQSPLNPNHLHLHLHQQQQIPALHQQHQQHHQQQQQIPLNAQMMPLAAAPQQNIWGANSTGWGQPFAHHQPAPPQAQTLAQVEAALGVSAAAPSLVPANALSLQEVEARMMAQHAAPPPQQQQQQHQVYQQQHQVYQQQQAYQQQVYQQQQQQQHHQGQQERTTSAFSNSRELPAAVSAMHISAKDPAHLPQPPEPSLVF